jgi:hypothetical protein
MSEIALAQSNVAAGATMLDAKEPNWFLRINIEILNIDSPSRCILGQLYGDYFNAAREMGIAGKEESLGFCIDWDSNELSFDDLEDAWKREIADRLGQPVVV